MKRTKRLSHLNPTKDNPRTLTNDQSETLDKQLAEFGPLDGIIYNINPGVDELVGGNRRTEKFTKLHDAEIVIEMRYKEPTRTGTIAEGYVRVGGERWSYREVDWPINKHRAAVVCANNAGGDNDLDALAEYSLDIEDAFKELMSIDFDELQPAPYMEPDTEKPTKTKKYSTAELREMVLGFYPAQADAVMEFCDWLDQRQ